MTTPLLVTQIGTLRSAIGYAELYATTDHRRWFVVHHDNGGQTGEYHVYPESSSWLLSIFDTVMYVALGV